MLGGSTKWANYGGMGLGMGSTMRILRGLAKSAEHPRTPRGFRARKGAARKGDPDEEATDWAFPIK